MIPGNSMRSKALFFLLSLLALLFSANLSFAQSGEILLLRVEGAVTPAMASYFERGINEAERSGSAAVLIILDTPGGALDTTQDIVQLFLASQVPVIVYVSPGGAQAASAGNAARGSLARPSHGRAALA